MRVATYQPPCQPAGEWMPTGSSEGFHHDPSRYAFISLIVESTYDNLGCQVAMVPWQEGAATIHDVVGDAPSDGDGRANDGGLLVS
jgi:hypothetical protein